MYCIEPPTQRDDATLYSMQIMHRYSPRSTLTSCLYSLSTPLKALILSLQSIAPHTRVVVAMIARNEVSQHINGFFARHTDCCWCRCFALLSASHLASAIFFSRLWRLDVMLWLEEVPAPFSSPVFRHDLSLILVESFRLASRVVSVDASSLVCLCVS
mmetsp:Transcript_19262/g.51447  ORF Transcript_19262/g.51447 Transcript_19262/m.51447 type:complete len:158 (-) Transcript_19262:90-563(-)